MLSLGIDIGGTSVKAAAARDGAVLWTGQSTPYARPATTRLLWAVQEAVGGRAAAFDAVGLCVPGLLDEARRSVTLSVNVPGLVGVPLTELVVAATLQNPPPAPVVMTDANATAYDVYTSRNLAGRLFALVIGTGVGAAVIDDGGRPLLVDGDSPGHFGQLDVTIEGEPVIGPDGGRGSLEGYVGAEALARRYGPGAAAEKMRPGDLPVRALARAVRIAHAVYRPQHVALAGGVGIRIGHLLPSLRELTESDLTRIARPGWTLTTGDSDFHAATGAARFAAAQMS